MWLVLLGCFLFQMLPYCVALNLTNVFVGSDWIVWTNGNQTIIGLTFTMGALGAAIAGPFIAKLLGKKINMRIVYSLGIVLAMIGFAGSSINAMIPSESRNVGAVATILFVSNIISQVGVMIFSGLGVNNLISKWWPSEKRGFALGIAFMGGSLGNIWMQQLVGQLAKVFGNISPQNGNYDVNGYQYATYLVMAGIGLVTGLLVVLFTCKKPLPPTDIFDAKSSEQTNVKQNAILEVSPLVTQKYPPYWILCVGYLILQMGTVHASTNGSFVSNVLLINNPTFGGGYTSIMALGGTLFGVFCLIGNFGGGILNDKIGPTKSIFLSGMLQCAAIVCLMLVGKQPALIYVYFILAGLSVYVYTSTPSFICGRLYGAGQSNNHMSILGMFIAVGFAIVNSISGALTGEVGTNLETEEIKNPQEMFGDVTAGNFFALGIFALVSMFVGVIIVVISSAIITNKGIKGLLEYSPTKYSRVIFFKHNFTIWLTSLGISISKKDFRNNEDRIQKIKTKSKSNPLNEAVKLYKETINKNFNKLNDSEKDIVFNISYYGIITKNQLELYSKDFDEKSLKSLLDKKIIELMEFAPIGNAYQLTSDTKQKMNLESLTNIHNILEKENISIANKLKSIDNKKETKIQKINSKLEEANSIEIDEGKVNLLVQKANLKIEVLNAKYEAKKSILETKDDWTKFKYEYAYLENVDHAEKLKTKLIDKKEAKIANLKKKIGIVGYVYNYNKLKQVEGHDLLVNYYSDKYNHIDNIISKKVKYNIEKKEDRLNKKFDSLKSKKDKIESTLL